MAGCFMRRRGARVATGSWLGWDELELLTLYNELRRVVFTVERHRALNLPECGSGDSPTAVEILQSGFEATRRRIYSQDRRRHLRGGCEVDTAVGQGKV